MTPPSEAGPYAKVEAATISQTVKEPAGKKEVEPVEIAEPKTVGQEVYDPIKVEALGRCPVCGKVIAVGQEECVKCHWKVEPDGLVRFET